MRLAVKRLHERALLPTRAYEADAGLDLYAAEHATIEPGARVSVGTGIAIEVPDRHAGLVVPRSGLAAQNGIALVNAPGLIDAGYRGELRVLLLNTDREQRFDVAPGDRIAQLLIVRVETLPVEERDELEGSDRGAQGFGSSG